MTNKGIPPMVLFPVRTGTARFRNAQVQGFFGKAFLEMMIQALSGKVG